MGEVLSDAFDYLSPDEQRDELRTLVRCVMVEAGEGPLADRVHVLRGATPSSCPGKASPASPAAGLHQLSPNRRSNPLPGWMRRDACLAVELGRRVTDMLNDGPLRLYPRSPTGTGEILAAGALFCELSSRVASSAERMR